VLVWDRKTLVFEHFLNRSCHQKTPFSYQKTPQKRHFWPQNDPFHIKTPSKTPFSHQKTPFSYQKTPFSYQKHLKNTIFLSKPPHFPIKNTSKTPQNPPQT
jgi:hypothetical protein